ncbi:hypothetical protein THAOC_28665, partial [Thalassiosira oceanica]
GICSIRYDTPKTSEFYVVRETGALTEVDGPSAAAARRHRALGSRCSPPQADVFTPAAASSDLQIQTRTGGQPTEVPPRSPIQISGQKKVWMVPDGWRAFLFLSGRLVLSSYHTNKTRLAEAPSGPFGDDNWPGSEPPPRNRIGIAMAFMPSRRRSPAARGKQSFPYFKADYLPRRREHKQPRADAPFDRADDDNGPGSAPQPQDRIGLFMAVMPSPWRPPAAVGKPSFSHFKADYLPDDVCRPRRPTIFGDFGKSSSGAKSSLGPVRCPNSVAGRVARMLWGDHSSSFAKDILTQVLYSSYDQALPLRPSPVSTSWLLILSRLAFLGIVDRPPLS